MRGLQPSQEDASRSIARSLEARDSVRSETPRPSESGSSSLLFGRRSRTPLTAIAAGSWGNPDRTKPPCAVEINRCIDERRGSLRRITSLQAPEPRGRTLMVVKEGLQVLDDIRRHVPKSIFAQTDDVSPHDVVHAMRHGHHRLDRL
jgi:hypothetical protein